ncbi:MAG: hypothetical protein IPP94_02935 [Ignavibacteria bacterium]|nr:hypothetical protein [Ignavibacteria bacterium]
MRILFSGLPLPRVVAFPAFALLLTLISACQHEPVAPVNQEPICFATEVLPVFKSNCAKSGCHDGVKTSPDLSTPAAIRATVTPGKPLESEGYTAMFNVWGGIMPPAPNAPVAREARQIVELWILQGADISCEGD